MSWRVEAQDPALVLAVTVNAIFSFAHFLSRRWAARASRSRRRARLESGLSDANWKAFRTEAALKSKRSLLSLNQFALQRASGGRSCWRHGGRRVLGNLYLHHLLHCVLHLLRLVLQIVIHVQENLDDNHYLDLYSIYILLFYEYQFFYV